VSKAAFSPLIFRGKLGKVQAVFAKSFDVGVQGGNFVAELVVFVVGLTRESCGVLGQ
jgi:ribosomal protein L21E